MRATAPLPLARCPTERPADRPADRPDHAKILPRCARQSVGRSDHPVSITHFGSWPEGRVGRTGTLSQQSTSHRLVDMSAEYTAVGKRLWVAYALPSGGDLSDVYADASETLCPRAPLRFPFSVFALPPSRLGPLAPPTYRDIHYPPPGHRI